MNAETTNSKNIIFLNETPNIIAGKTHTDHRGTLQFCNEFDMTHIKRFYAITHTSTEIRRGWRGHRIEQRWFSIVRGAFLVRLVKIDNWESPSKGLPIEEYTLVEAETQVLHVPAGYASLIQAIEQQSTLLVFADYGIDAAKNDDYLYNQDYFGQ